MTEASKARPRREAAGWYSKYFVGNGLDVGCGNDKVTPDCVGWDLKDGDAQYLRGVANGLFDWVHSSHCLEHMVDPKVALENWWRVLKPGGYLIVGVPDEDLYEQGFWPSGFNGDHKTTWTIHKDRSWSPVSRNLKDMLQALPNAEIELIQQVDTNYRYKLESRVIISWQDRLGNYQEEWDNKKPVPVIDQTAQWWNAEAMVEAVVRKTTHSSDNCHCDLCIPRREGFEIDG